MSLKTAITTKHSIVQVYKGILTISEIGADYNINVLYSCFCEDIPVYHPLYGKGEIVSFKNNLWQIDFITSSALQEFSTKTLLNYLPN